MLIAFLPYLYIWYKYIRLYKNIIFIAKIWFICVWAPFAAAFTYIFNVWLYFRFTTFIKTSTRGWGEREKKDDNKLAQILLYKEYFGRQFGFDVDRIEVEYFIVKRKIWEASEFAIPRVQSFKPASGKTKRRQAVESLNNFIKDCFDESGKPQIKSYLKNTGEKSCKWCPYADKPELCDKKN